MTRGSGCLWGSRDSFVAAKAGMGEGTVPSSVPFGSDLWVLKARERKKIESERELKK